MIKDLDFSTSYEVTMEEIEDLPTIKEQFLRNRVIVSYNHVIDHTMFKMPGPLMVQEEKTEDEKILGNIVKFLQNETTDLWCRTYENSSYGIAMSNVTGKRFTNQIIIRFNSDNDLKNFKKYFMLIAKLAA